MEMIMWCRRDGSRSPYWVFRLSGNLDQAACGLEANFTKAFFDEHEGLRPALTRPSFGLNALDDLALLAMRESGLYAVKSVKRLPIAASITLVDSHKMLRCIRTLC